MKGSQAVLISMVFNALGACFCIANGVIRIYEGGLLLGIVQFVLTIGFLILFAIVANLHAKYTKEERDNGTRT